MALIQHTDLAPEGFKCNANGQLEPVVKETVTTIVNNGDGTYTYTNEAGTAVTIDTATTVTATDNGDGTFTLLDDNGNTVTIDTNNIVTTVTNTVAGHKIGDYTNEAAAVVAINETITSLAGGTGDNLLTFTKEDGTTDVIDLSTVLEQYSCPNAYFTGTGVDAIQ